MIAQAWAPSGPPDHAVETDKPLSEMTAAELDDLIRQYQMDLNVLRATDGELVTADRT